MSELKKNLKNTLAKVIAEILPSKIMRSKSYFHLWEAKGYHVTPVQYYEPVPDTFKFETDIFKRESAIAGVEMNEERQLSLCKKFCTNYKDEYCKFSYDLTVNKEDDFYFGNGAFECVDAEVLYCMVRFFKPKNIIEIGSGFSTRVTAMAIRQNIKDNSEYNCNFLCIEPYPKKWISKISEVTNLIKAEVESLPLDMFKVLDENDIIFIDSSHIIKVYNDVCFEYLELIPSLNKGVIVHVHDIVLPQIYSDYWYDSIFFWNEQYLLQAFLAFNKSFQILWAANFMHLKYSHELAKAFPSYLKFKKNRNTVTQKQGHKSFWFQRIQ